MIEKVTKPIQKELEIFDKRYKVALSTDVKLLLKISNYILKNTGKRIRPILLLLVSKLLGEINEKTYSSCILIELLHTATLIHDDVIDDASFRRGKFSINNLWKNKIAVLAGDFLLSKGLSLGLKDNDINILAYTSKAVEKISEGEIFQIQKSRDLDLNEKDYYNIISRKTGSLFACCFQLAAVSNGIHSKKKMESLYNMGLKFGMIFQIKDDILDYSSSDITGKIMGNDLKESKINLPLLLAIKNFSFLERQKVYYILKKKQKKKEDIYYVNNLVKKKNGISLSEMKMYSLKKELINDLTIFSDSVYKTALIQLTQLIIDRKK
ncbi:MAG: polyprenyl synthetase family protein [Bacteroidota bacterium]|nr:polyprenyl synthetase family protein [Bacteroidota bacterium]